MGKVTCYIKKPQTESKKERQEGGYIVSYHKANIGERANPTHHCHLFATDT